MPESERAQLLLGQIKDAFLHCVVASKDGEKSAIPTDEEFTKMAKYVDNVAPTDYFEAPYLALKKGINDVLDLRDDGGNTIGATIFATGSPGDRLQKTLQGALLKAESYCF